MAKKVKPGKLRGNTTPNLLTPDPNGYTLQLEGGMKYSLADIVQLVIHDGATVKSAQDLEESFRMVLEKGIEMSLMGNNMSLEYIQMRYPLSAECDSKDKTNKGYYGILQENQTENQRQVVSHCCHRWQTRQNR